MITKLEFGNAEQIADLRRMEKLQSLLKAWETPEDKRTEEQNDLLAEDRPYYEHPVEGEPKESESMYLVLVSVTLSSVWAQPAASAKEARERVANRLLNMAVEDIRDQLEYGEGDWKVTLAGTGGEVRCEWGLDLWRAELAALKAKYEREVPE